MFTGKTKAIVALIATAVLFIFIIGLAKSITDGFAGFWGGLPFWVIAVSVLAMAAYNYWEECLKKK
ncbi:MAG: hypothetical protein ACC634_02195 [Hyphomicrobiales bacterium]